MSQTLAICIGDKVTYNGDNRAYLKGKVGIVASITDAGSVGVDIPGEPSLVYGAEWSWMPAEEEPPTDFMEPHKATLDNIDAEMERLRKRLIELQTARQVIASL